MMDILMWRGRALVVGLSCGTFLSACSLPEPDGTEATLKARAASLSPLPTSPQHDARGVVQNGLILHSEVREAASEVAQSADQVRVERAGLFPSVGLSFGGGAGAAGDGDPALQLTGKQLIADFGNTDRAITSADMDLQIKYLTFQKSVDDAIVELLKAFDAVQMYEKELVIRQNQLAGMQDLLSRVEERNTAGASSNTDLLEARKRLQSIEFEVQDAELALSDARDQLARRSGQSSGGMVPVPRSDCRRVAESDDYRIAKLKVVKAELDLENARKSKMPKVNLSPLARAGNGGGLGLNLSVDSDLLQGGAYTARVNATTNALAAAKASVDTASRDDALDARKLTRDISAADRKRDMLQRQIELLGETRELYRSQYFDLGTRTISELLDNEEEYYERQSDLVELASDDLANRLDCSVRNGSLRGMYGLTNKKIYGLPLQRTEDELNMASRSKS